MLLDCQNNQLIQPNDTQAYSATYKSIIPREILKQDYKINLEYQNNINQQEKKFLQLEKLVQILRHKTCRQTQQEDTYKALDIIRRELCSLANCQQSLTSNLKEQELCLAQIDIAYIRIASFQKHLYNLDQTTFVASIYEIDQAIREKQQEQLDPKLQ